MTKQTEAMKLALEALEIARDQIVDPEYAPIGWSVSRLDEVLETLREALAEPQEKYQYGTPLLDAMTGKAQQEPVAWDLYQLLSFWMDKPVAWMIWTHGPVLVFMNKDEANMEFDRLNHAYPEPMRMLVPLYTSPPAQRKPLHIGEETAAFKAWFDAWWIGDGEQGETIPTQSDKHFLTYLDQYTLGFGAWMAAKHAAHGIKENK